MESMQNKLLRFCQPLSRRSCGIPDGFPLDCMASIRDFEDATDEEYSTVHLFTERLSESVTWTGSNETMALKGSRIMEAFEDKRLDFRCFTYFCAVLLALSETFRVLVSNSQLDFIGFSFPIALCVF
ncbi:hypothetical protein PV326_008231, partial [Microctonus aethiopoides]